MGVRWFILLMISYSATEVVHFESGETFNVVDPARVVGDVSEYEDPKNTGSILLDFDADNSEKRRLSTNVMVSNFRSRSSRYFRVHPVFVSCLQRVITELQNEDAGVMLYSAYKTRSDTGDSTSLQDLYARAGTGAQLSFRSKNTGDVRNIARAVLKFCPPIFDRIQRDVGVIMMKDRVHVHMTGADDIGPHFSCDGFAEMTTPAFVTWALDAINLGLDPVELPDCSNFSGLDSGTTFPAGAETPADIVGEVDTPVTRDTLQDYVRLVQYLGTNVDFSNPERSASWCHEEGTPCVDCSSGPISCHISKRCANRLMTARMYNYLKVLQKMTRTDIPGSKLKVLKAFDEPYAGNTEYSVTSLHVEGRQLSLQLDTANTVANLKIVTKHAQCLGVDFVRHNGDYIILAVRKMKGIIAHKVEFPQGIELIAVQPPADKMAAYRLPDKFSNDEEAYPLFDSNGHETDLLAPSTPLRLFVSKDSEFRYFRLDPRIPKCLSLIQYQLNKRNEDGDPETTLDVSQGFMSTTEQTLKISTLDKRFDSFTLGVAMEIRYSQNPRNLALNNLVQAASDKCGPLFKQSNENVGIGIYKDRVFVDSRNEFEVWMNDDASLPANFDSVQAYLTALKARNEAAISKIP